MSYIRFDIKSANSTHEEGTKHYGVVYFEFALMSEETEIPHAADKVAVCIKLHGAIGKALRKDIKLARGKEVCNALYSDAMKTISAKHKRGYTEMGRSLAYDGCEMTIPEEGEVRTLMMLDSSSGEMLSNLKPVADRLDPLSSILSHGDQLQIVSHLRSMIESGDSDEMLEFEEEMPKPKLDREAVYGSAWGGW